MERCFDWKKKREEDLEIENALKVFLSEGGTPEFYSMLSEKERLKAEFEYKLSVRRKAREQVNAELGTRKKLKNRKGRSTTRKILALSEVFVQEEIL